MKKFAVVLILVALVASSAFAALIQIGPTGRYNGDITDVEAYQDFSNYAYGVDARVNLGAFGVAANALYGGDFKDVHKFDSFITLNYRLDFSLVDFAIGAGYRVFISNDNLTGDWTVNDEPLENTFDVLKNSQLLLRAAVGVNLGGIGVSADYKLPYETIVGMINDGAFDPEEAQKGQVSISLLLNLL